MNPDQEAGRALLTGALMGLLLQQQHLYQNAETLLPIHDVEVATDSDGNYQPVLFVTMNSGKYQITVSPASTIEEEK